MPRIIDYHDLLARMKQHGFRCLYHNSGAFGFAAGAEAHVRGWIGPADASIRPEALKVARSIPPPYEHNLANLAKRAWLEHLPGDVWVMPMSHWAYELDFSSRDWLPPLLGRSGIDPLPLHHRADGSAIEFAMTESPEFFPLLQGLLLHLEASDFMLVFLTHATLCTVHHHKQLWWQSSNGAVAQLLQDIT